MSQKKENAASSVALGGVLAAFALVVMCMGGLIPVATFVCPVICIMLLATVLKKSGARIAWAWYGAVALLSLLLGPDKEAAAVFLFLGYYPILKPWLDSRKFRWIWKFLLFNAAILLMYTVLIHVLGMAELTEEFAELGTIMTGITLVLGNITFWLLDRLLSMRFGRGK